MTLNWESLPKDIQWHMIGHVQTNKVKYMAPYVSLIHGVDRHKLLKEINKQGAKNNRVIDCLLQMHIAQEETKFGFNLLALNEISNLVKVKAVKTDVKIPIANVIEKPLTGPEAIKNNIIAAINVVIFASVTGDDQDHCGAIMMLLPSLLLDFQLPWVNYCNRQGS